LERNTVVRKFNPKRKCKRKVHGAGAALVAGETAFDGGQDGEVGPVANLLPRRKYSTQHSMA
jgi:hypothetical protein